MMGTEPRAGVAQESAGMRAPKADKARWTGPAAQTDSVPTRTSSLSHFRAQKSVAYIRLDRLD